jgi:hypothetical protein
VHYLLFSIKVYLVHLNVDNKSALKVNLLKFINMYCKSCVYSKKLRYLEKSHFRIFSCYYIVVNGANIKLMMIQLPTEKKISAKLANK